MLTINKPFVVMPYIVYVLRDELNCGQSFGKFKICLFANLWKVLELDLSSDIENESYKRAYAAISNVIFSSFSSISFILKLA